MNLQNLTAFNTLLLRICSFDYPPGTLLSENKLSTEFGLSRTPMREVLQYLAHYGLVTAKNGIGTVVTELSDSEIIDLSAFRQHLSLMLMEVVSVDNWNDLAEHYHEMSIQSASMYGTHSVQRFASIGLEIHRSIAGTITNKEFKAVWDRLYYKHSRFSYRLMHTDWKKCVEMQTGELVAFSNVLSSGDVKVLSYLYKYVIEMWTKFSLSQDREDSATEISDNLIQKATAACGCSKTDPD